MAMLRANVATRNDPLRRFVLAAVSSLLRERGIDTTDTETLQVLTVALQILLRKIGNLARSCAEHAGRTQPVLSDVLVALSFIGIDMEHVQAHAHRSNATPPLLTPLSTYILWAYPTGHLPDTDLMLPMLPPPHNYKRSYAACELVTDEAIRRERSANQKRDVERALTSFMTRTRETESLSGMENSDAFPLITSSNNRPAYLRALIPEDQGFHFDEESLFPIEQWDDEDGEEDNTTINNPYLIPAILPSTEKESDK